MLPGEANVSWGKDMCSGSAQQGTGSKATKAAAAESVILQHSGPRAKDQPALGGGRFQTTNGPEKNGSISGAFGYGDSFSTAPNDVPLLSGAKCNKLDK